MTTCLRLNKAFTKWVLSNYYGCNCEINSLKCFSLQGRKSLRQANKLFSVNKPPYYFMRAHLSSRDQVPRYRSRLRSLPYIVSCILCFYDLSLFKEILSKLQEYGHSSQNILFVPTLLILFVICLNL